MTDKKNKNYKYHFKIEEHESCYTLNKIVFNKKYHHPSIATIWFSDFDNNMLSKEKAYEIIIKIKKHLEEVE